MNKEKLFLILDIDGVLLESHGYRDAYVDSVNSVIRQIGQPDISIDRKAADAFEAAGIAAEWDMLPLTIAAFVNWYCERSGQIPSGNEFPPFCGAVRLNDAADFQKVLLDQTANYAMLLDPECLVPDAIYKGYQTGEGRGLEHLWKLPCRDRFFKDTLTPDNPLFAELMTRILGSGTYETFFRRSAPKKCASYLVTRDLLLISDKYRSLLPEIAGKNVYPVVMTYRPTQLPGSAGNQCGSYFVNTPEGERALELLGWTDGRIPMIGGGSLCYIEEKYGRRREYYVKPHPLHALASMFYALCRNETEALEIARSLCELDPMKDKNPAVEYLSPKNPFRIAVFEDSVTGIKCVRNAADVLREWGYEVKTVFCGIRTTDAKNNRLLYAGAALYPNINSALDKTLENFV